MGKRKYYFPPKSPIPAKRNIHISDDVKAELEKIATEMADREIARRQAEDLNNYIAFTLEALSRLGWTGQLRLNRFLKMLTCVCSEAEKSDDGPAYADGIKEKFKKKGVSAFVGNDDAEGGNREAKQKIRTTS